MTFVLKASVLPPSVFSRSRGILPNSGMSKVNDVVGSGVETVRLIFEPFDPVTVTSLPFSQSARGMILNGELWNAVGMVYCGVNQ